MRTKSGTILQSTSQNSKSNRVQYEEQVAEIDFVHVFDKKALQTDLFLFTYISFPSLLHPFFFLVKMILHFLQSHNFLIWRMVHVTVGKDFV